MDKVSALKLAVIDKHNEVQYWHKFYRELFIKQERQITFYKKRVSELESTLQAINNIHNWRARNGE